MRFFAFATVVTMLAGTSGCATIVSGTTQDVSVSSNPAGADVQILQSPGGPAAVVAAGRAPMGTTLPRDHEYIVVVSAPGYQEVRVKISKTFNMWVLGNLCCTVLLGGAIDLITGAFWKLEPNSIMVNLLPGNPGAAPPGTPVSPGVPNTPAPAPAQPVQPAPPTYSPTTCSESIDLYAVFRAVDSEGQMRTLTVPMIRQTNVQTARATQATVSVW